MGRLRQPRSPPSLTLSLCLPALPAIKDDESIQFTKEDSEPPPSQLSCPPLISCVLQLPLSSLWVTPSALASSHPGYPGIVGVVMGKVVNGVLVDKIGGRVGLFSALGMLVPDPCRHYLL